MGLIHKTGGNKISVPALLALILGLMLYGGMSGPAWAAPIGCGQCHSLPPATSDSGCVLTSNHGAHSATDSVFPNLTGAMSVCLRCHPVPVNSLPTAVHDNGITNITSLSGLGMRYSYNTAASTGTCTKACHKNEGTATWSASGSAGTLDCNACHFRSGAPGGYTMSGQHGVAQYAPGSFGHYSSLIKVMNNTQTVTCSNCHNVYPSDNLAPRTHINSSDTFRQRADISNAHYVMATFRKVTGVGYTPGAAAAQSTCTASCHNSYKNYSSSSSVFRVNAVLFSPTISKTFGAYSSSAWGKTDLRCNECHSVPSQSSTYGGSSSINANNHHKAHLFTYKLSANNPNITGDKNIYCTDCHRFPNPMGTQVFKGHSTVGQGGSGMISLPVNSTNVKMNLTYKNNNIGQNGVNPAKFSLHTTTINNVLQPPTTCSNVYCHTALYAATWTDQACNSCHGTQNDVLTGSGAPGYSNTTSVYTTPYTTGPGGTQDYNGAGGIGGGGAHYMHVAVRGYSCNTCHSRGGKDGNPANHNKGNGTVLRTNVNVNVNPQWWFKNSSSVYNTTTETCSNVKCHYGTSKQWACYP